jgi:hypothetical protein
MVRPARRHDETDGRPVVLFPDTFNNYFHTGVGVACVEAIEAAGWQVVLPGSHLCCGRPLYDYGFLDAAERYLHRVPGTGRRALHTAELMKLARTQERARAHRPGRPAPERDAARSRPAPPLLHRVLRVSAAGATGAALVALAARVLRAAGLRSVGGSGGGRTTRR